MTRGAHIPRPAEKPGLSRRKKPVLLSASDFRKGSISI